MKKGDVAFQILLSFLQNPSFEVNKVERMWIFDLFCLEPLDEKRKVIRNLFPVENSINHMTTKQSHLDFISSVRVYFCIFVYRFKNIRSC
jgi:hypothetical protein